MGLVGEFGRSNGRKRKLSVIGDEKGVRDEKKVDLNGPGGNGASE